MSTKAPVTFERNFEGVRTNIVDFKTSDGVSLTASLTMPEDKGKLKKLAIVNSHGTNGSFYGGVPGFLPPLVARAGYASLSFNDRGAGADYPLSTLEDFLKDMEAALEYMGEEGFTTFLLTGHSLGVVKVTYYQGVTKDKRTKALALYGPSGADMPKRARLEFLGPKPYAKFEENCKKLMKQKQDYKLLFMPWTGGRKLVCTPKNWLSFRGTRSKARPVRWLKEIELPVFLAYSHVEMVPRSEIEDIRRVTKNLTFLELPSIKPVDGHFFVGKEVEVAEATIKWLSDLRLDQ